MNAEKIYLERGWIKILYLNNFLSAWRQLKVGRALFFYITELVSIFCYIFI